MWNASHLVARLCALRHWKRVSHAANHTIPPPPSNEGYPFCPKDKKPLAVSRRKTPDSNMISWKGAMPISQKR